MLCFVLTGLRPDPCRSVARSRLATPRRVSLYSRNRAASGRRLSPRYPTRFPLPIRMAAAASPASAGRTISRVVMAREQSEGDGARVRRSIGSHALPDLDPFLLLDEFRVTPPAGFPTHPHRGMQTVTYMLSGAFQHKVGDEFLFAGLPLCAVPFCVICPCLGVCSSLTPTCLVFVCYYQSMAPISSSLDLHFSVHVLRIGSVSLCGTGQSGACWHHRTRILAMDAGRVRSPTLGDARNRRPQRWTATLADIAGGRQDEPARLPGGVGRVCTYCHLP